MHARRGGRDIGNVVDAFGGFQNGVNEDRLLDCVFGFELGQKLIEIVNVPGAFDLGQHHHIELAADRGDDLGNVVEHPG